MNRRLYFLAALALLGLVAAATWWWWRPPAAAQAPVVAAPSAPPASAASATQAPAASSAAVHYPVEAAAVVAEAASQPASVDEVLTELFGRKAVQSMFQLPDFPRRFVATVDNLGRAHAPAIIWPVNPAEGRFTVKSTGEGGVIDPDNGLRYTAHVLILETVDLRQAAAAYARLYPSFQQAYVDLGFPKKYFNDRLVEVLDQLLATPEVNGPIKVHIPPIQGPLQPERPWVLYEFDDPALNALTSGQRILLRMGPVNERRVKARLAEFRHLITAAVPTR